MVWLVVRVGPGGAPDLHSAHAVKVSAETECDAMNAADDPEFADSTFHVSALPGGADVEKEINAWRGVVGR